MPMIEMTLPAGAIDQDTLDGLTDQLAETLLRWEGAPDTDFFRANTWLYVNEVPAGALRVGGRPGEDARFRVDITTPQGALSQRRRGELVKEVTAAVQEAAGIPEEELYRVWVLCREIDEGSWGAGGGIVMFEGLKAAAKHERDGVAAEA